MKGSPQKLTRAAALPSPTSTITNEILSLSSLQKGSSTFDWPEQAFILGKTSDCQRSFSALFNTKRMDVISGFSMNGLSMVLKGCCALYIRRQTLNHTTSP